MQPSQEFLDNQGLTLLRHLGSGGMGAVYLVERDQELFALKTLSLAATNERGTAEKRFQAEFEIMHELDHPHIVKAFELFQENELLLHMLLEYVPGKTLSDCIAAQNLDLKAKLTILQQLATALAYIHQAGIVHRDIKPGNVLVERERLTVKLSDFGVLKAQAADLELTKTGSNVGTAYYMAPEQIRAEAIDARADIYSFGVLTFELFTARKPFEGETQFDITRAHLLSEVPLLRSISPETPKAIEKMVAICLEKDREHRYQSMDELVDILIPLTVTKRSFFSRIFN
jgi:serine/threonine-protein kinase